MRGFRKVLLGGLREQLFTVNRDPQSNIAARKALRDGIPACCQSLAQSPFTLGGFLCRPALKFLKPRPAPFFVDVPAFAVINHPAVIANEAKP